MDYLAAITRFLLFPALGLSLVLTTGCGDGRVVCEDDGDCQGSERCLYVHTGDNPRMVCATTCSGDDECESPLLCEPNGSSCESCLDLVNVCD